MFKNKRITLLTLYPVMIVLVIFLVQACCERKERLTGEGELSHYSLVDSISAVDTIRGPFALYVYYERNVISAIPEPVSTLSATKCAIDIVNPLLPSSFSFRMNSPIYGMNDTLEAGTDLSHVSGIEKTVDDYYSTVNIKVTQAFLDEYSIPDGFHEMVIAGSTTNGIALSDSLKIAFRL